MPVINLPISKGLVQSNAEGDWLDSLPTNMLTVPEAGICRWLYEELARTGENI